MSTVDAPPREVGVVTSRTRTWAAVLVPVGPLIMFAGYVATIRAGDTSGWPVFFALLSTPFLLITATVAAASCWRAAPRAAAIALAGLVSNIIGLAALHGIEASHLVLQRSGMDRTAIDAAFESFTSLPVGWLEVGLFFVGHLVGFVALLWAQFRNPALPWHVPILSLLFGVADFTIPDAAPAPVKAAGIALFVAWSITLALAIRRPVRRAPLRGRSAVVG